MNKCRTLVYACAFGLLLAGAAQGVTFQNVPNDFSHQPSTRLQTLIGYFSDGVMDVPTEYVPAPFKPYGVPGVAVFDYDNDGDLDIYVTNGPGGGSSLFANQLAETHSLSFVDVAAAAGVELADSDNQGVCFGDIDNDSDADLLVLGFNGANHLFENDGDGTFTDISASSHIGGQAFNGVSCAMGDVNNDGLLDIAVANAFDFTTMLSITAEPVIHNQPNQLFLNDGGNSFTDASASSGIQDKVVAADYPADLTWSVVMVDYDKDGDVDVFFGNDMRAGGFANTFLSLFKNDGTGHFTDATATAALNSLGSWRGLSFGDINCDGRLDLFAANLGDYIFFPGQIPAGAFSSAWFLQQANGTFARQAPGALKTVPNGWSNAMIDYDNDGDLDLVNYGNQDDTLFWDNSNGGVILNNTGGCSAAFTWDDQALGDPTRHVRHNIEGLATGDLNNDGFDDIISVSSFNVDPDQGLAPIFSNPLGSVFDVAAKAVYVTVPTTDPNKFAFTGAQGIPGELFIEINSGNSNKWAKVSLVGTSGITTGGKSNRDGIGAVVSYNRPVGSTVSSVTRPVLGGSGMLSQGSLDLTFGLGGGRRGMVEILWPGGAKNRLYGLRLGEHVSIPEIPCSFDAHWDTTGDYVTCVAEALEEVRGAGLIDGAEQVRLFLSALHAYLDVRGLPF
jgi:hypothetical protein